VAEEQGPQVRPTSVGQPFDRNMSEPPVILQREKSLREFIVEVTAGLVVAALVGVASYAWATLRAKEAVERAPEIYVEELDKLITKAVAEGEGSAVLNGQAIVAARNSLATSLSALGTQLDSQIDVLAKTVGSKTLIPNGGSVADESQGRVPFDSPSVNHQAYMEILILQKIWPSKKRQIEIEIKKLFAELGLYDRR
jgi:hypothetical protein